MPYMISPRDLVSRPDNMDEIVLHTARTFVIILSQATSSQTVSKS